MKYIASCSFGKDSLAMVLMLIERGLPLDEVVFYDTGMEFQAIYDLRDDMLPIFQQHGIKYTTLYPDSPFLYDILDRVSCWCCCNKNLKELRNIRRYLPEYWEKLKHLQAQLERPMKGFYKGQPRGVFELDERFVREDRDT